jgi:hypothetical protein
MLLPASWTNEAMRKRHWSSSWRKSRRRELPYRLRLPQLDYKVCLLSTSISHLLLTRLNRTALPQPKRQRHEVFYGRKETLNGREVRTQAIEEKISSQPSRASEAKQVSKANRQGRQTEKAVVEATVRPQSFFGCGP